MPPRKNSVVPKKWASKVLRYFGDNLDGAIVKFLLCKHNPTKGDTHKSSLVNWYSSSQVRPWSLTLSRLHQSLEKPPASTPQAVRGRGEIRKKVNCHLFDWLILLPRLEEIKMHHESIAKFSWLALDPFLVSKTFYFNNRGFHVRTSRKQQI